MHTNTPRYNPNVHHRKSIRLKGYDYAQPGLFFITICCKDRVHLFGHIENNKMILNSCGLIAHNEWLKTTQIRDNVELGEFIIMPNHMHAITNNWCHYSRIQIIRYKTIKFV